LKEATGTNLKCYLNFRTRKNEAILVKVGLSGVSVEGALKNLDTEISDWSFERIRRQAHEKWDKELSNIKIQTDSERDQEVFYTALYHTMLAPTLFDDVDGQYRGMDGRIHQSSGFHNYSTFSLWDTYRAAHPLYNLNQKERVSDMIKCLIAMTEESPQKIVPIWPLAGNETGCMIGYHAVDVIAEAFLKGITGFDSERAYRLMKNQALMQDYRGLGDYQKLGYVPSDKEAESASKTVEYSYDDWAIAQMARKLGKDDDYQHFLKRAGSYKNLFDPATGFIRPRREDGRWASPFDPKKTGTSDPWRDFTEANAWQYSWPQQDPVGYMGLLGGKKVFVQKLDALFSQSAAVEGEVPADMTGLIGMYAHGNEPSHHIAYLYNYAGVPFKTQERVREILAKMYGNTPDGLSGNEDCGQMSAWYVFSALGFYPVDPVSGNYVMGSPLFPQATIELGNGKLLVIKAPSTSAANKYVQSVTLNDKPYSKTWFNHRDIVNGGVFVFQMGNHPNPRYGIGPDDIPPSMSH
jgi:predicted alpha-1,2-mannosidase